MLDKNIVTDEAHEGDLVQMIDNPSIVARIVEDIAENIGNRTIRYVDLPSGKVPYNPNLYRVLLRAGTRFNDDCVPKVTIKSTYLFSNAYSDQCHMVGDDIYIIKNEISKQLKIFTKETAINPDKFIENINAAKTILKFFQDNWSL